MRIKPRDIREKGLRESLVRPHPLSRYPVILLSQQGGFSPFMFGLIMGMGVFSALSMQWAKQSLEDYEKLQAQRSQKNAEEVAKGLDFAILTENKQTYSDSYNLDRARRFSDSDGTTQGGQAYMVTAREDDTETRTRYGHNASTVAITASDDTLLRSQMHRTTNAEQILRYKTGEKQAVATYDTASARDRQIRTSAARMATLAEQVYAFYAARMRFPTDDEYLTIRSTFGIRDAWGNPFEYELAKDGEKGTLSFTTPWNYTQTLNMSLKDEEDEAE